MPNPYFRFKQFTVHHDRCAMKVTTDACLFGAWCAAQLRGEKGAALDIGAGTGLLSLMVAQKTGLQIDAVELETAAAEQAAENAAASPWKDRIKVHQSDIREYQPNLVYPFIFSNPPFYENELESEKGKRNLAHHSGGLRLQELLQEINRLLAPDGTAFLLLPFKREKEIEQLLSKAGFYINSKLVVFPKIGNGPFRIFYTVIKEKRATFSQSELWIQNEHQEYTPQFVQLLQDYYLYL